MSASLHHDRVAARVLDPVTDTSDVAPQDAAVLTADPQTEPTAWSETEVELTDAVQADDGTALLDAVTDVFAAQGIHTPTASVAARDEGGHGSGREQRTGA